MKRVVVNIDHLVLKGFAECRGKAIAAGLRDELYRSLFDQEALRGLASQGGAAVIRLGSLNFSDDASLGKGLGKRLVEPGGVK